MHPEQFNDRLAYSVVDAAKAVSISRSQLYLEIKAGRLKTVKVGVRTLVLADDLGAWLNSHRAAA